jgi:hypothetical protein
VLLEKLYQVPNSNLGPYFSGMSGDGKTILFGKNYNNTNYHPTECTIAKYNSSNWTYTDVSDNSEFICQDQANDDQNIGYDGTFFLSPNSRSYENVGDKVFQLIAGTMNQLGGEIESSPNYQISSLSSDGNLVCTVSHSGGQNAFFEIWEYKNAAWSLRGSRTYVEEASKSNDLTTCSLSHNNKRVVVGAPQSYVDNMNSRGYFKVYEFIGNDWSEIGDTIRTNNKNFSSPRINGEGNIVAAKHYNFSNDLLVFKENNTEWNQIGNAITDGIVNNGVSSFAMNKSGNMIAVITNVPTDTGSFNQANERISVYQYVDNEWYKVLARETLTSSSDSSNGRLTLSDDGQTISHSKGFGSGVWQIIRITDPNIAPVFTSESIFSAAENQTAIGTVTATDADSDAVTFTVSGSELAITSGGVLTFISAPDYESKSTFTATVIASDSVNNITTQDITINVTDVDFAP